MAVKPTVRLLSSHISHMAFLSVWRDSGVTQRHGFDLTVHVTAQNVPGQPFLRFEDRAPKLLDGSYDLYKWSTKRRQAASMQPQVGGQPG